MEALLFLKTILHNYLYFKKGVYLLITCIATDMDGTLLNSQEKISEANAAAIKKAQAAGLQVVVATGRAYDEARHLLGEAGIKCPVISVNGAVVWDEEGKIVSSIPMSMPEFKQARMTLDKQQLHYEIYTNKGLYTKSAEVSVATLADIILSAMPHLDKDRVIQQAKERFTLDYIVTVNDYDVLYDDPEIEIYKILVFSAEIDKLTSAGETIKSETTLAVTSSGHGNVEITNKKAQKGIALETFVNERHLSLQHTMAMGDSYNDVSMFKKVGRPIAMGNAVQAIKDICGEVTLTNEENGVAHAILQVLEENEAPKNN